MEIETSPRYQSRKSPITLSLQPCEGGRRGDVRCGVSGTISQARSQSRGVVARARAVRDERPRSLGPGSLTTPRLRPAPAGNGGLLRDHCCRGPCGRPGTTIPHQYAMSHKHQRGPITNFRPFPIWYLFIHKTVLILRPCRLTNTAFYLYIFVSDKS